MASDMFLKLEGIDGESEDDTKSKEIELLGWNWGGSNSATMGSGGGAGAGKGVLQELSITKYMDRATTVLVKKMMAGEHIDKGTLTCRKSGGEQLEYLIIELKGVFISSYSTGGGQGEEQLVEQVSLSYEEVTVKYTPQKSDGSGDVAVTMGWNVKKNAEAVVA